MSKIATVSTATLYRQHKFDSWLVDQRDFQPRANYKEKKIFSKGFHKSELKKELLTEPRLVVVKQKVVCF